MRPAVSKSDGPVPAAKKRAPNISLTRAKKPIAVGLNKSGAKTMIVGGPSEPVLAKYLAN